MIDGGLRTIFRQNLPSFHWQSIESGLTGGGIPDSNACKNGIEFWIEYKKTDNNKIGLRPDQVGWHMRRSRVGGRSFIAVRYRHEGGPRRGMPVDTLYIYAGRDAQAVAISGLALTPLGMWPGGPSAWDWWAVNRILLRSGAR